MTEFPRAPEELELDLDSGKDSSAAPQRRRGFLSTLLALPRWLISRYGLMFLGGAAVCGLIYMMSQGDGFVRQGELEEERARLVSEIEILKDENRLLRERLERLKNDPAFVEDEARKKLGLIRSGETVYRLSEEPDLGGDAEAPALP